MMSILVREGVYPRSSQLRSHEVVSERKAFQPVPHYAGASGAGADGAGEGHGQVPPEGESGD